MLAGGLTAANLVSISLFSVKTRSLVRGAANVANLVEIGLVGLFVLVKTGKIDS
jgi:hypothetical protein